MSDKYVPVKTGIHDTVVRKSDGKGITEVHRDGECGRDCPICVSAALERLS